MSSFGISALFVISCILGSLAAPPYEPAPSYGGGGGGYGGGHTTIHTYPAKPPAVKCGANLLVGCAPQVSHVPCSPSYGGGYGGGHAAPAPSYGGYPAPAPSYGGYRAFEQGAHEVED